MLRKMEWTSLALVLVLWAGDAFALDKAVEAAEKRFKQAQAAGNTGEMVKAVQDLGVAGDKDAVEFLLNVALQTDAIFAEPEKNIGAINTIFDAAREALIGVKNPEAVDYIIKRARQGNKDSRVRILLADVVSRMDSAQAIEAIVAMLKAKETAEDVLTVVVPAAGKKHILAAVTPLIDIVERTEKGRGLLWFEGRSSLTDITGYDFGTSKEWHDFWNVKGKDFDPTRDRGDKQEGGTVIPQGTPSIFSTEVISKRVVFVIDVSGSMHIKDPAVGGEASSTPGQGGGDKVCPVCGEKHGGVDLPDSRSRIERVKSEMTALVKALDKDTRFTIIAYSTDVIPWQKKSSALVQATLDNKDDAAKFVKEFKADGCTQTQKGLEAAFEIEGADTIFLLSDGSPTDTGGKVVDTAPIIEVIKQKNKFKHLKIQALGFHGANVAFMEELARVGEGKYKDIQ